MSKIIQEIIQSYPLSSSDARALNPQALAFVGDAVHTLFARTLFTTEEFVKTEKLHKQTAGIINATKQSEIAEKMFPLFNETEQYIFKRGRNYHTHATAKNASAASYHMATGLEAVLGYTYLIADEERLKELLNMINDFSKDN